MKKIDLKKEAKKTNVVNAPEQISQELLLELCPKAVLPLFRKAKSAASRADFLYELDRNDLKKLRDEYNKMDKFVKKLEAWFVQEFQGDQRGVAGKVGRVEVKSKEIASVEDWEKFYAFLAKKKEFDLLNKAINQRAVQERWEQRKEIPGVGKFVKKVISLTGVKGKK